MMRETQARIQGIYNEISIETDFSCSFQWIQRCMSTMDEVKDALSDGALPPIALFADEQIAGRGRNGNRWHHAEDGIAGSFALRQLDSHAACSGLSLVVGVSVVELFQQYGITLQLKWPNDLLTISGEKVGGILIQLYEHHGGILPNIGIGINIGSPPTEGEDVPVAGLSLQGQREEIAAQMVLSLQRDLALFQQCGFQEFQARFHRLAAFRGERIAFQYGQETVSGVFQGVDAAGGLIICEEGSEKVYHSGDTVRRIV